jgi:hypothetical protein
MAFVPITVGLSTVNQEITGKGALMLFISLTAGFSLFSILLNYLFESNENKRRLATIIIFVFIFIAILILFSNLFLN